MKYLMVFFMMIVFVGVIRSADVSAVENKVYTLEPLWETDVEEAPYFRMISKVLQKSNGDFVVLDPASLVIYVFSKDGEYLNNINFYGDGPGELSAVKEIAMDSNDNIYLMSPFGPVVVKLQAKWNKVDGASKGDLSQEKDDMASGMSMEIYDDKVLISSLDSINRRLAFHTFSTKSFEQLDLIVGFRSFSEFSKRDKVLLEIDSYFAKYKPYCLTSKGEFYIAHSWSNKEDCYRIDKYSLIGDLELSFKKNYSKEKRTNSELLLAENVLFGGQESANQFKQMVEVELEKYDPDIVFMCEYKNELWVETFDSFTSSTSSNIFRSFDVFSRQGEFLNTINILCEECDSKKDELYLFDDTIIVVKGMYDKMNDPSGDADLMQILCFKLVGGDNHVN